jgi:20S proteasome subunit alpha 6
LYRIHPLLEAIAFNSHVKRVQTNTHARYFFLLFAGGLEDLIRHGLHALRETLQQDKELTTNNTSIGILGPCGEHEAAGTSVDFRILEGTPIEVYLQTMQPKEVPPPSASASASASASTSSASAAPPPLGGDEDVQMSES